MNISSLGQLRVQYLAQESCWLEYSGIEPTIPQLVDNLCYPSLSHSHIIIIM